MIKENVSHVVKNGLCCSCGVCSAVCGKHAISFVYGKERNYPVVDDLVCGDCGLCAKTCPGKGINIAQRSAELYAEDAVHNEYSGYFVHAYVGHSNDSEIRFHSASGGVTTEFLRYALRQGIIDGAVVVRYKNDNPFEPEPFIARSEADLLQTRGSKYLVISYDKIIEEMKKPGQKIAVVGLPCQISGFRKLADINKQVYQNVVGYFAIYCSLNKTKHSMDYYMYRYGVKRDEVRTFSFRDDGCLGYMKFTGDDGRVIKKVPYEKYWHGTHSFFVNERCAMCADHFGELADISFGDIHIKPYSDDKIGINSIVVRNKYWDAILRKCSNEKAIALTELPIDDVVASQIYVKIYKKGGGIRAYTKLRRAIGKQVPEYDFEIRGTVTIKNYMQEIVKIVMRRMGAYRCFWPIIKLQDK